MPSTANSNGGDRGDLGALLGVLARRSPIILLSVLIGVGVAVALSASQPDRYRSTSELLFRPLYLDAQLTGLPLSVPGDSDRDAETNVRLVDTATVHTRVAARLGGRATTASVAKDVTVSPAGGSSIVSVKGSAERPRDAKRLADLMATEFVAYRRGAIRSAIDRAEDGVKQQLAIGGSKEVKRALRLSLRKLQLLAAGGGNDVQVASFGTLPRSPFEPKPVTAGIIGGFIGLIVGFALALVTEQLDRRLRRPEQLTRDLDLALLAEVPRSKVLRKGEGWRKGLPGNEAEAFRRLRANLRYLGDADVRSVLVTSAASESGKTTVALHLAVAAAGAGGRVLLLEADLRRPRLRTLLDLEAGEAGLSTLLQDPAADMEGVGRFTTEWSHSTQNGDAKSNGHHPMALQGSLDVLLAGPPPPNPSELLDSERMWRLLDTLQRQYDLIVIDGPPTSIVSDSVPLAKRADGVVLVTRLNRENRDDLDELRAEFDRLDVRVFGAVANFSRRRQSAYYSSVT